MFKDNTSRVFNYQQFKDSILGATAGELPETTNVFDAARFVPGRDPADALLDSYESVWRNEEISMRSEHIILAENAGAENLESLRNFHDNRVENRGGNCRQKECPLYVEIIKSKQMLYIHLDGTLIDSFEVSTGVKGRETPNFSLHPSGPIFIRYTSRKFPGGDYLGLGNMPYAVFIKGGYAIHGTTPGNFQRLGSPASHGCIRIHPDNAKVFINLIKQVGLGSTWITIKDV